MAFARFWASFPLAVATKRQWPKRSLLLECAAASSPTVLAIHPWRVTLYLGSRDGQGKDLRRVKVCTLSHLEQGYTVAGVPAGDTFVAARSWTGVQAASVHLAPCSLERWAWKAFQARSRRGSLAAKPFKATRRRTFCEAAVGGRVPLHCRQCATAAAFARLPRRPVGTTQPQVQL